MHADAEEVSSGLMWIGAVAAPWECVADVHVYNVRLGPPEGPQIQRPGLTWLKFKDGSDAGAPLYIQVHQGAEAIRIASLDIDGRRCDLTATR